LSIAAVAPLLAQADPTASLLGGPNSMFFLVAIFFAIFYFMIIRPQQKQQKTLENYLSGLKKGDEVLTAGGLIGRIDKVQDTVLTLEIASNVKVRILKTLVTGPFAPPEPKAEAKPDAKPEPKSDAKAEPDKAEKSEKK
jgi:preprotein translocase subunit YajC